MTIRSKSDAETREIGFKMGKKLAKGTSVLLCLYGELGTGKTTFIRGLAKGLGITSRITAMLSLLYTWVNRPASTRFPASSDATITSIVTGVLLSFQG